MVLNAVTLNEVKGLGCQQALDSSLRSE